MMSFGEPSPGCRFCVSRKGGMQGDGWVHPQGIRVFMAMFMCERGLALPAQVLVSVGLVRFATVLTVADSTSVAVLSMKIQENWI